jgi:hypothetical protein
MQRIDQHSPEGKALQATIKRKLSDFLGAGYNDEVRAYGCVRGMPATSVHALSTACSDLHGRYPSCVRQQALHIRRYDIVIGPH